MLSNCLIDLMRTTMMPSFSFGRLMCSSSLAVSIAWQTRLVFLDSLASGTVMTASMLPVRARGVQGC